MGANRPNTGEYGAYSPDYWALLGVPRHATDAQVHRAWRLAMFRHHPDHADFGRVAECSEYAVWLNVAHDTLLDSRERERYLTRLLAWEAERGCVAVEVRPESPAPAVTVRGCGGPAPAGNPPVGISSPPSVLRVLAWAAAAYFGIYAVEMLYVVVSALVRYYAGQGG